MSLENVEGREGWQKGREVNEFRKGREGWQKGREVNEFRKGREGWQKRREVNEFRKGREGWQKRRRKWTCDNERIPAPPFCPVSTRQKTN